MVAGSAALTLVHGRPVVTLDGGVRAVVDTGASAVLITQSLADSMGLAVIETVEERGEVFTVLEPPSLAAGGHDLDVDGVPAYGFEDTRAIGLAALGVDLLLPAPVLARHAVVLDLVEGSCSFGAAGSLPAFGVRVGGARVADDGVRVVCECEVLGRPVVLLLDTGVSCSLAADRVVQSWLGAVADLPTSAACVGPGNMAGLAVEARTPMVRVPVLEWGREFTVPGVAFVWRGDADVAPYDGSLGGNVLRWFRLGLDVSRGEVFVEQRAPVAFGGDADQVGVTLVLGDDGDWVIGSTVTGLSPAVRAGDVLVAVDGAPVGGVPLGDVLAALGGAVGVTSHHLVVRRGDVGLVEADAPVVRVL